MQKVASRMTDDRFTEMKQAAEWAASVGERVFGEGGVVRQIAAGDWDGEFDAQGAKDAAGVLRTVAEHVLFTRADGAGAFTTPPTDPNRDWLMGLPINRKERFYTGTVLPMLVATEDFAHLGRFLRLCGIDVQINSARGALGEVSFVTEYGFAESVYTSADREKWDTKSAGDTPDVVIAGADWLVAVGAKMFHNPSAVDLDLQMRRQALIVQRWTAILGLDPGRVKHTLLLPETLARASSGHGWPVTTWEQVYDSYKIVGPRYWSNVLLTALASYDELVSKGPTFGANKDANLTGAEIVVGFDAGTIPYTSVGRGGGLAGPAFADDIDSCAWQSRRYEVRLGEPPNPNWFTIEQFVDATRS